MYVGLGEFEKECVSGIYTFKDCLDLECLINFFFVRL